MGDDGRLSDIDQSLVARLATLSTGSQRWLKTAIQAIRSDELVPPAAPDVYEQPPPRKPPLLKPAATLEDVITGKADLREQLEAYPELSDELDGLADIIDLLRETGERRRRRGEDVLKELLEGERTEEDSDEETPPKRPKR
jgi:hypothetical protein